MALSNGINILTDDYFVLSQSTRWQTVGWTGGQGPLSLVQRSRASVL